MAAIELLVTGRLVGGHPMTTKVKMDDKTNLPVMQADGVTPRTEAYMGIAIPKGPEPQWTQTEWGAAIYKAGVEGWPSGEYQATTFAWKVVDGDSTVPNKKGIKPCTREGYPGHWVLSCSTGWAVKCFYAGKYDPAQQIQNANEIKPGDYCRVSLSVKGNASAQSPGVYLNPGLFEMYRAGTEIALGGPAAADVFGGTTATLPANAQLDKAVQPPLEHGGSPDIPPAPRGVPNQATPPAAPDFLTGQPVKYDTGNGLCHTEEELIRAGWTPEQIAACPVVNPPPIQPPVEGPPAPTPKAPMYVVNGTSYSEEQLITAGWTPEQIAACPVDIPF